MHLPGLPLTTPRLRLEPLTEADAPFIHALLTDADFLRHIGDRGVRSEAEALRYIETGPRASYAQHGFGLFRVTHRADGAALGICGLLRRPGLDHADLGYALLPSARGHGYAEEAARAALAHGFETLRLPRIVAITSPDNAPSIRVLEKIGLRAEGPFRLGEEEVLLFAGERALKRSSRTEDARRRPG